MERIVIISGLRTPMAKAGGAFKTLQADTLGSKLVREVVLRSPLSFAEIDEVIIGNVAQPIHAANIARVIALRAGFSEATPAMTVHRNCASGMESITTHRCCQNPCRRGKKPVVIQNAWGSGPYMQAMLSLQRPGLR